MIRRTVADMRAVRAAAVTGLVLLLGSGCSSSGTSEPRAGSTRPDSHASSSPATTQPASHSRGPWARLTARPLRIPHLRPGAPCPVTRTWTAGRRLDLPPYFTPRRKLGTGPVYPGVYTPLRRWYRHTIFEMPRIAHPDVPLPDHWLMAKVLWQMRRDYRTPLIVRGHQVDGPHEMRFFQGGGRPHQIRLLRNTNGPSNLAVPVPGCYAWQLDGKGIRKILVFKVVQHGRH
jgi:hypothetical protein